jgi:D-serine deaminase-like pyridoxal phosphate-dependent protein
MRSVREREHLGWRAELPSVRHALELVDRPGSRWAVPTPALVLDIDAFDRNVALMAARAKEAGLTLRPHAKSHKSSALARRQLNAGAVAVCCAKLGEAEALAAGGVRAVLITSPLVDATLVRRLAALAEDYRTADRNGWWLRVAARTRQVNATVSVQ